MHESPENIKRRVAEIRGHLAGGRTKRAVLLALLLHDIALDLPERIEKGTIYVEKNPKYQDYLQSLIEAKDEALDILGYINIKYLSGPERTRQLAELILGGEVIGDEYSASGGDVESDNVRTGPGDSDESRGRGDRQLPQGE